MCTSTEALAKAEVAPLVHAPVEMLTRIRSIESLPCTPARDDAAASTASHSNVRDDRDTPLSRDGMAR